MSRLALAILIILLPTACDAGSRPDPAQTTASEAATSPATSAPASGPTADATTPAPDPWLMTVEGIGPYQLGARVDAMPPGIITSLVPIDTTACPELYSAQATGIYAGALLFVVRHSHLVEISSSGGSPGVHSAQGDKVGDPWPTVEARHTSGAWQTAPDGERAFIVPSGDRVMMFMRNPIRPAGVGAYTVGMTDHSQATFLSGANC